ncbi:MAG: IS256 family transposase [Caldithrix sp.]|nr:IS256 family transposase [Caldithrix sp.]
MMERKLRPSDLLHKQIEDLISGEGEHSLKDLLKLATGKILQEALESEVTDYLGRDWYERNTAREGNNGYRNGYYNRKVRSGEGSFNINVPRLREDTDSFESQILKRLKELENNLQHLATELYVRGLSTRDIESIFVDETGKTYLSRTSVSHLTERLNDEYEQFRKRDLSIYDVVYLYADGVYESVRAYTANQTILCGWGVCSDGRKVLLHLQVSCSENEQSWSDFFEDMLSRGLRHPLLVISDGHRGLKKAITRVFPKARRQRCVAHKLRNLMNKVPLQDQKEVKEQAHMVYYAADKSSAEVLASRFIEKYVNKYPAMVNSFQEDMDACLTQLDFPVGHRKVIRTTNLIERAFVEEKRRTKIIPAHYNEKGAIKLVYGVLIRASNKWQRVAMSELDLTILKNIRKTILGKENDDKYLSYDVAA